MLSFEQKLEILESYTELQRKNVSLGRVNFHYEESQSDKKTVALHLHPNGNGYVYAGLLQGYVLDDKGFANIREFTEEQLKTLIDASIRSLSSHEEEKESVSDSVSQESIFYDTEVWMNKDGESLTLTRDDDLWYIYTGPNIEMVLGTMKEAREYLMDEGFRPSRD
ncbi:hypothetical protein [Paenibacillus glacialis]|uniref:Uncharacterized protein n=1 Tax=Paenibacillus glacialis TaxID=494026 RepID=A0A168F9Z2_9BACL|nr:hypothetical protein [Paenibacillus glacialis]OAB35998.1 hypothetical protein PGLA_21470 [Paenibacillus glacialis]